MNKPLWRNWRKSFTSLLFLLVLAGCGRKSPDITQLPPLPQDPFIQVYFNASEAASYTDPYRQIHRLGDNLEEKIIEAIATAETSIDIAVQEFRLPELARALAERANAGVKIRIILENKYSRSWSQYSDGELAEIPERDRDRYEEFLALVDLNEDGTLSPDELNQRDAFAILNNAGIEIRDDTADGSKGSGLMHHKFIVIDNRELIVSSANFTTSGIHGDFDSPDSRGNANHLLQIQSITLSEIFTEEFNLLWGNNIGTSQFGLNKPRRGLQKVRVGTTPVSVFFSPTSASKEWSNSGNGAIAQTLKTAETAIDIATFVFSEQQLSNVLHILSQNGITVRTLIDRSFIYRYYSEGLDMLGVALAEKCKYEPDNLPWLRPIKTVGTPALPPGDKLHHKFAIIDEKTVITGSQNWSAAANHKNDETILILENPTVAAHFDREFQRLYRIAQIGIPEKVAQRLEAQQKECPVIAAPSNLPIRGKVVNLNTATIVELEALPGVGETLAQRIIAAREQQPFKSLEDLDRVKGVGPSLLKKLEGRVTW
ncbi:DUF655 domain-containing protein [Roseofilum casamattae]|uniref:phospholipase D n=1 Tax=Roseofilum casamattae BLCC-M143 TaxID=3022442 RepID=A0ABT7BZU8_9CYAN|nr:DUF655 domain-containing protein [Roseofilum casamattae]MDJ1184327.1 DUF655 domain-containing protein [Roseofilum casamattae BLCC-M143]